MSRIKVEIDGVTAEGELFESKAPSSAEKVLSTLPLAGVLRHTRVSGNCAEFAAPELQAAGAVIENQVSFLDPASISYRPDTGTLIFSYGQAQARSATANLWVVGLGRILSNHDAFYAQLQAARDKGPRQITIRRGEEG